jgi:hypothetical protein
LSVWQKYNLFLNRRTREIGTECDGPEFLARRNRKLTQLIATDVWTMLSWRGLFGGLLIGAHIAWQERAAARAAFVAIGWLNPGAVHAMTALKQNR